MFYQYLITLPAPSETQKNNIQQRRMRPTNELSFSDKDSGNILSDANKHGRIAVRFKQERPTQLGQIKMQGFLTRLHGC